MHAQLGARSARRACRRARAGRSTPTRAAAAAAAASPATTCKLDAIRVRADPQLARALARSGRRGRSRSSKYAGSPAGPSRRDELVGIRAPRRGCRRTSPSTRGRRDTARTPKPSTVAPSTDQRHRRRCRDEHLSRSVSPRARDQRDARAVEPRRGRRRPDRRSGGAPSPTAAWSCAGPGRLLAARGERQRTCDDRGSMRSIVQASDDYVCTLSAPIVAFAKDWHEDPTSNHHVLRELARTRRVLWLNSIATRTPKLASGRDLGKIRRKLARVRARAGQRRERSVGRVAARAAAPAQRAPRARSTARSCARRSARCACGSASATSSCGRSCRTSPTTSARSASRSPSTTASTSGRCSATSTASRPSRPSARCSARSTRCSRSTTRSPTPSARSTRDTFVSPHGVDHALFARALDRRDARAGRPRRAAAARASASTARCATGSISS